MKENKTKIIRDDLMLYNDLGKNLDLFIVRNTLIIGLFCPSNLVRTDQYNRGVGLRFIFLKVSGVFEIVTLYIIPPTNSPMCPP